MANPKEKPASTPADSGKPADKKGGFVKRALVLAFKVIVAVVCIWAIARIAQPALEG